MESSSSSSDSSSSLKVVPTFDVFIKDKDQSRFENLIKELDLESGYGVPIKTRPIQHTYIIKKSDRRKLLPVLKEKDIPYTLEMPIHREHIFHPDELALLGWFVIGIAGIALLFFFFS